MTGKKGGGEPQGELRGSVARRGTVSEPTLWRTPQGELLTCYEKLDVLNQNIDEVAVALQDVMEEGVLVGCDDAQLRHVLHGLVERLRSPYQRRQKES